MKRLDFYLRGFPVDFFAVERDVIIFIRKTTFFVEFVVRGHLKTMLTIGGR